MRAKSDHGVTSRRRERARRGPGDGREALHELARALGRGDDASARDGLRPARELREIAGARGVARARRDARRRAAAVGEVVARARSVVRAAPRARGARRERAQRISATTTAHSCTGRRARAAARRLSARSARLERRELAGGARHQPDARRRDRRAPAAAPRSPAASATRAGSRSGRGCRGCRRRRRGGASAPSRHDQRGHEERAADRAEDAAGRSRSPPAAPEEADQRPEVRDQRCRPRAVDVRAATSARMRVGVALAARLGEAPRAARALPGVELDDLARLGVLEREEPDGGQLADRADRRRAIATTSCRRWRRRERAPQSRDRLRLSPATGNRRGRTTTARRRVTRVDEVERAREVGAAPLGLEARGFAHEAQHVRGGPARRDELLDPVGEEDEADPVDRCGRAESASTPAISTACSRLVASPEPSAPDALISTTKTTVSCRSSRYFLTKVRPVRAVAFQSMARTSSPGSYSRTSSKSMPRPRKRDCTPPWNGRCRGAACGSRCCRTLLRDALCHGRVHARRSASRRHAPSASTRRTISSAVDALGLGLEARA